MVPKNQPMTDCLCLLAVHSLKLYDVWTTQVLYHITNKRNPFPLDSHTCKVSCVNIWYLSNIRGSWLRIHQSQTDRLHLWHKITACTPEERWPWRWAYCKVPEPLTQSHLSIYLCSITYFSHLSRLLYQQLTPEQLSQTYISVARYRFIGPQNAREQPEFRPNVSVA